MIRRFVLILTAAASSGCFNFDGAYNQFCDGGRCNGSTGGGSGGGSTIGGGGGSATGGSGGGGSTTGGGGGGGSATGGSGGGGSTTGGGGGAVDAGCQQFLCPVLDWSSSRSSIHYQVAGALMTESINRFHVIGSFEADQPGNANFTHFEYRFVDGGLQQTIDQLGTQDRGLREALPAFLDSLRSHVWLDGGRLAGYRQEVLGRLAK